jgi:inner membrane protein
MDNVTHTLIGIALGRAAWPRTKEAPASHRALLWAAAVSSNLPDIDFLFPQARVDGNLGYMLHHRGHTHTLLWAVPLGLLVAGAVLKLDRKARPDWLRVMIVSVIGAIGHIVADSWNSYGVHPFWPVDNRWFYGDFIFIVEPLLWFALLPLAFECSRRSRWRWGWLGLGILMLGLAWAGPLIPALLAGALTVWALALVLLQRRFGGFVPATVASLVVLTGFFLGSRATLADLRDYFARNAPGEREIQLALTPGPANPFCWLMVSAHQAGADYVARIARYSTAGPGWDQRLCETRLIPTERTAPTRPVSLPEAPGLRWYGEFRAPLQELRTLAGERCGVAAFLQFSRNPFWVRETRPAHGWIVGDLRFDRKSELEFSEIDDSRTWSCPSMAVRWEPPVRSAL